MKSRLAVILMADVVDYSAAMEMDQAGTIAMIQELRETWLEPQARQRGGEVLKRMGDGWIIAFSSVGHAVETARAVQSYRWRTGRWPDSLDDLMPKMIKEAPIDPWGRPLQYEKRKNGYRLSCLGGDGRVGGDGDATDFVVINGNFVSDPANEGPF